MTSISTRLLEGPEPRLILDRAELTVIAGPDRGLGCELGLDSVIIGTDAGSDLVLTDPTVSSRHAHIFVGEDGFVLRDLRSKNGIMVGTLRVNELPLTDGLRIRLGTTGMEIRKLEGTITHELGTPRVVATMIAHSVAMRAVASTLERLAASDISILLEGETGCGKEVAAQVIHQSSARAGGPFVVFDCGAQTAALIAAELFGHERGAFTGATQSRDGALANADGGTLFLDEIGEMPLELQPVLLRALEARASRRVGGNTELRHDVRIVAASNRRLGDQVRAGRFRQDLFHRLAAARVRIPPLRERPEDITPLAHAFARELGVSLSPELLALLHSHDWPGNVRELRNTIRRIEISSEPQFVVQDLGGSALLELPEARRIAIEEFERSYVDRVLAAADGSVSRAASLAGVSRQFLSRLMTRHGLRRGSG
jgi:DNA-binding NtrC family response regulator